MRCINSGGDSRLLAAALAREAQEEAATHIAVCDDAVGFVARESAVALETTIESLLPPYAAWRQPATSTARQRGNSPNCSDYRRRVRQDTHDLITRVLHNSLASAWPLEVCG